MFLKRQIDSFINENNCMSRRYFFAIFNQYLMDIFILHLIYIFFRCVKEIFIKHF